MNKKRKIGVIIILIGIGIPLSLIFFADWDDDDVVVFGSLIVKEMERKLTQDEIKAIEEIEMMKKSEMSEIRRELYTSMENWRKEHLGEDYYKQKWTVRNKIKLVPYQHTIGTGIILILIGIGFIIFSFSPKE